MMLYFFLDLKLIPCPVVEHSEDAVDFACPQLIPLVKHTHTAKVKVSFLRIIFLNGENMAAIDPSFERLH